MTTRTWVGGNDSNDAGSAANWSPGGAPQPGDNLNVTTGTLEVGPGDLAGNVLHVNDAAIDVGPVVLNMGGWGARAAIDGSLLFGDALTVNAVGQTYLSAPGGFSATEGSINLADHAHLYVMGGSMRFAYSGAITGGIASRLTNYGRIELTNAKVSTLVNGDGTLAFDGYHDGPGVSEIAAPVTSAQTVELNPEFFGLTMVLSDPANFHALLRMDHVINGGNVAVVVKGVHADGFGTFGNNVLLTDGGRPVDLLRVADVGGMSITPSYGGDTTLLFHINS